MPDRQELPEQFRSSRGVFSVLPDSRPFRWSIWDLEGCVGEIFLVDGVWHSHPEPHVGADGVSDGIHRTWEGAADAVLTA